MLTFIVVLVEPRIEISLQDVDRLLDLRAEGHAIELVRHDLVQPFDDPFGAVAIRV